MSTTTAMATTPAHLATSQDGLKPKTVVEGHPGPNDKYECKNTAWLFGTTYSNKPDAGGDLLAFKVAQPKSRDAKLTLYGKINPHQSLKNYVVRGSSHFRFFAWSPNNELVTFTWGVDGKISKISEPITPPAPLSYHSNRQLRTVDEHGNIFHINAAGDLMRSTVSIVEGRGIFTSVGEVVVPSVQMPAGVNGLWAGGDGVVHLLIKDRSMTLKMDTRTHRIVSPLKVTAKEDRQNEDYVASVGGSVDYALSRTNSASYRYRYDPAHTTDDTRWPEKITTIKHARFAELDSFAGFLDGCTRNDLNDAPLNQEVAWDKNASTQFVQAGETLFTTFKNQGLSSSWGHMSLAKTPTNNHFERHVLSQSHGIRPPIGLAPVDSSAWLHAHTKTGAVITGKADDKAEKFTSMGGNFPTSPIAVPLTTKKTLLIGIDPNGKLWLSHRNSDTHASWKLIPGLTLPAESKITAHRIDNTSAKLFALNQEGNLISVDITTSGVLSSLATLPRLPGGAAFRAGVGVTNAEEVFHIVVASTTGKIFRIRQEKTAWAAAWQGVSDENFTPGVPSIYDDFISGRTYIFARDTQNYFQHFVESATADNQFESPRQVPGTEKTAMIDDPSLKPLVVEQQQTFGTVARTVRGETVLVYANTKPADIPQRRSALTFITSHLD